MAVERGAERLMDTLELWAPICAALSASERAMREARFILLGGPGALLTRADQAVAVLEAGIAAAQKPRQEVEEDVNQMTLEEGL